MTQELKTSRGGTRANSGMKSSGIESVTVRIDKRLLNVVTEIKADFKKGKLIAELNAPKQGDATLLKKIARLEREKDDAHGMLQNQQKAHDADIERLNDRIKKLQQLVEIAQSALKLSQASGYTMPSGLNEKLRKRLVQFCHPDKHQDAKAKAIAVELVQELNKLGG